MDIDTSSYPKPQAPVNALDTVAKIQNIQRNDLAISQDKLDLYDKQYNIVNRGLGNLIHVPQGELTPGHLQDFYQGLTKLGIPAETVAKEMSAIPAYSVIKKQNPQASEDQIQAIMDQKIRKMAEVHMLQAQEKHDALNYYLGRNADKDVGNQTAFGNEGKVNATGYGMSPSTFQQTGPSLVRQPAPGTPAVDENNNSIFNRARPPQYIAPGAVQSAPLPPVKSKLPITQDIGPAEAASNSERVRQGGGADRPAPPTNFTEGKQQYNDDINTATAKLTQIKPAQQAIKLMDPEVIKGLTGTGKIANAATKVLSEASNFGLIPKSMTDPVAQRQELVKKLAQYVSSNPVGQRSDAAQTLAEASSPNPNVQVLPALINLTRDAIALDRVQAARALSFENKGNNYQEYPLHRAGFPNAIDERAFKLDLMPAKERDDLIESIKKSNNKAEREKFINSLRIAQKLKMFD